jgi:hypothetical protein
MAIKSSSRMNAALAVGGGLDLDQAGQHTGNLHHGEDGLPAGHALALFVQKNGQVQAAIAQRRKRMPLIHGQRREHRPHVARETNLQGGLLLVGEIAWPDQTMPALLASFGAMSPRQFWYSARTMSWVRALIRANCSAGGMPSALTSTTPPATSCLSPPRGP